MIKPTITKNLLIVGIVITILATCVAGLRLGYSINRQRLISEKFAQAGEYVSERMDTRFTTVDQADLLLTGNSLVLSPNDRNKNNMYLPKDYGAVFMSLDDNTSATDYDANTTIDWRKNGSSAKLDIPAGSEVLYALLVWGGSFQSQQNKDNSVESEIAIPVTLISPTGEESISKDSLFSYRYNKELALRNIRKAQYLNTRDITDVVRKAGSGMYGVKGVPAILDKPYQSIKNEFVSPENMAGWSIIVAYKNQKLPVKSLSVMSGIVPGDEEIDKSKAITIAKLPPQSNKPVQATLLLSASEGDSDRDGDQILFGGPTTGLAPLDAQFNQRNNFFASQIQNSEGVIDTTGLFGTNNMPIGESGFASRQGWDIASLDITGNIRSNQREFHILGLAGKDNYALNLIGLAIQPDSADLSVTYSTNTTIADQSIVTIANNGRLPASQVRIDFEDPSNPGRSLLEESMLDSISLSQYPTDKLQFNQLGLTLKDFPAQSRFMFRIKDGTILKSLNSFKFSYSYEQADQTKIQIRFNSYTPYRGNQLETLTTPSNQPPSALDDVIFVNPDVPTTLDVLTNDVDPDGKLIVESLKIAEKPVHGSASVISGAFMYTPNQNFLGQDSITYEICDNKSSCKNAKVTIVVTELTPSSDIPETTGTLPNLGSQNLGNNLITNQITNWSRIKSIVSGALSITSTIGKTFMLGHTVFAQSQNLTVSKPLGSDNAQVESGENVTIDVLRNDTLDKATAYSVSVTKAPENGVVAVKDNALVYKSAKNYSGIDFLVYTVCDPDNNCSSAPVTIDVSPAISSSVSSQKQLSLTPISGFEVSTILLSSLCILVGIFAVYSYNIFRLEKSRSLISYTRKD